MIREAVGVFDNVRDLNLAVAELEREFPRHDISIMGGPAEVEKQFGTRDIPTPALEDHPDAPREILIRPEEKTIGAAFFVGGGIYAGAISGAFIAGLHEPLLHLLSVMGLGAFIGGVLGGLVITALEHRYNNALRWQISKGGILLWVRTHRRRQEAMARGIMSRYGAQDVHIHELQ